LPCDPDGVVEVHREPRQTELRAVVKVVLEAPTGVVGRRDETRAGSAQARGELFSLGDDSGETECRQCRNGDEELRVEDAARDRLEVERPRVVGRAPNCEESGDCNGDCRPPLAEAQRSPDQPWEDEIEHRVIA
jgi:hypothetical protein